MKHVAVLACLLSFCLVSACIPVANAPIAPDPTPAPSSAPSAAPPADTQTNPFPRLANPQAGQPLEVAEYFADAGNGVKVQQVTVTGGTDDDADGALDYRVQAKVDLGEKGLHDVEIAEEVAPPGSGLPDVYVVTDKTDPSAFVFALSADATEAVIRQGESTFTIAITGDHKLSLNGQPPVELDAAAQQTMEAMFKDKVSPHALALLFSKLIRTPVEGAQGYRIQTGASPLMLMRSLHEQLIFLILLMLMGVYMPPAL